MGKKTKPPHDTPLQFRSRIVGEGMEAPDQLLANPQNWRRHPKEQLAALEGLLDTVGWVQRVIVNRATGHMVDGHARVELALRRDEKQVPVLYVDLSADEERPVLASLDPIGGLAQTDQAMLDELLDGVGSGNAGLDEFLAGLQTTQGSGGGNTDPDAVPAPMPFIVSRRADVWALGESRLLCGDCTDESAIDALMAGERADLCLTDPPYGLGEKKASGKNNYAEYIDSRVNLVNLARLWLPLARKHSEAVVFSPGVTNQWIYPEPTWVLCWFYGAGQLRSSWGFNCWQPFLAYGRDPSLAAGKGGRPDAVNLNVPANMGEIDHPCPKPAALWEWMLRRLVFKEGALLYEPFSGSGTTLVTAWSAGHRVRAVELTPRYVDVAVLRWQAFTGLQATLEGDGRTFDQIAAERAAVEA
jgi:hypothetical protein